MLKFTVWAGNMKCGTLLVFCNLGGGQLFESRDHVLTGSVHAVDKVAGYKHLRLVRV